MSQFPWASDHEPVPITQWLWATDHASAAEPMPKSQSTSQCSYEPAPMSQCQTAHEPGPMNQCLWASAHEPVPMSQFPWANAHEPAPMSQCLWASAHESSIGLLNVGNIGGCLKLTREAVCLSAGNWRPFFPWRSIIPAAQYGAAVIHDRLTASQSRFNFPLLQPHCSDYDIAIDDKINLSVQ